MTAENRRRRQKGFNLFVKPVGEYADEYTKYVSAYIDTCNEAIGSQSKGV